MIVTTPYTYHSQGGAFGIITGKYCIEVEKMIHVAKSKGYRPPTEYQLNQLNWFINEQKSSPLWNKRDIMYWSGYNSLFTRDIFSGDLPPGQYDSLEKFCRINLKNAYTNELLPIQNTNSFYYNKWGFSSNSNQNGYDTQYNPGDGGTYKWVRDSASVAVYITTNTTVAAVGSLIGVADSGNNLRMVDLIPRTTSNVVNIAINRTNNGTNVGSTSDERGYWLVERTASNNTSVYQNNSLIGSTAQASKVITCSYNVALLCRNQNNTYTAGRLDTYGSYYAFGESINDSVLRKLDYELVKELRSRLGYGTN